MKFNFSTTYFMEIYKGARGNNVKIYESSYWVDDLDEHFKGLCFDDSLLCKADPNSAIEFKFINRNQYQMINTEIAHIQTTYGELQKAAGQAALPMTNSQKESKLGKLKVNKF